MAKQKRLRKARAALTRALELTEKLLDGFPIPGVKGTIGTILEIIKEAGRMASNTELCNDLRAHLQSLNDELLQPLVGKTADDIPKTTQAAVETCMECIIDGLKQLSQPKEGLLSRWINSKEMEDEMRNLVKHIELNTRAYMIGAILRQELAQHQQGAAIQRVEGHQHEGAQDNRRIERTNALDKLRRAREAKLDSSVQPLDEDGKLLLCFKDTRVTILDKIINCINDPNSPPIFWLHGLAGTLGLRHDGKRLASRGEDGTIRIYDLPSGSPIATLRRPESSTCIRHIAYHPTMEELAVGQGDCVVLWRQKGTTSDWVPSIHSRTGYHNRWITGIAYCENGTRMYTSADYGVIKFWATTTTTQVQEVPKHGDSVSSYAVNPPTFLLATGSRDKSIIVWKFTTGDYWRTLLGHTGSVLSLKFSDDGVLLASGSDDRTAMVWDVATGGLLHQLGPSNDCKKVLAFNEDNAHLTTKSYRDFSADSVWELKSGKLLKQQYSPVDETHTRPYNLKKFLGWHMVEVSKYLLCRPPDGYQTSIQRNPIVGERAAILCDDGRVLILDITRVMHQWTGVCAGFRTHSIMTPNDNLQERCTKCGTTIAQLGQRLKRCGRCGGGGLDFATGPPVDSCFQNEVCQAADWESDKRMSKKLPPSVDGRAVCTLMSSWFIVYKALLEWTVYQASLTQTDDFDSDPLFLVVELDYSEEASERDVSCLYSTRLMFPVEGQTSGLPDPFKEEGAKIIQCTLRGCVITHKCATFDRFKGKRPCSRWHYVVADMIAFGFQNEKQMKKALPLVITRHNMFEAFVGEVLRREPFPRPSRSLPAELEVGPWIWIKDPLFITWFTRATGKTIATRVAELEPQTSQDKSLEILLQWAKNPVLPSLDDHRSISRDEVFQ